MNYPHRSSGLLRRLFSAAIGLLSLTATVQAHNLDTRATTIFVDKDFVATMNARAALGQQLIQVNDEFWLVVKTTPGPGTLTGVGGYQTFYVPSGVQVTGAQVCEPDPANPGGFRMIAAKGQSIIAVGAGSIGQKVAVGLTGYQYPTNNINGFGTSNTLPVSAAELSRGTIAGVYADTGIFYSTDPATALNSYGAPSVGVDHPAFMKNNSGDQAGELDAVNVPGTDILGVMTQWDSWQLRAFGRSDVAPLIDLADGRGNAPWGMASAVAGPESGYRWSFDYELYKANGGTTAQKIQAGIEDGPWQRIRYAGSQISYDIPGSTSTTLGYAGIDGSAIGRDLNGSPLNALPTSTNAVRFAIGMLELGVPSFARVKVKVITLPNCPTFYADAFGGDAGGEQGGKDHIWRYFDPTVVSVSPCVLLQKVASVPVVAPGGTMYFDITFANSGVTALNNVVLTDSLPAGMVFLSSVPPPSTGPVAPNPTYTWSLGTVPPNAVRTVRLNVRCDNTGTLVNSVTATGSNFSSVTAYDSVLVQLQSRLSEVKTVSPTSTQPGGTVTYTITVSNSGTAPNGSPLIINELLPAGFTYFPLNQTIIADLNGGTPGPGVVTANASNPNQPYFTVTQGINVGKTLVLKFNVTVGAGVAVGTYYNQVSMNFESKTVSGVPEAPVTIGGGQIGDTVFRDWNGNGVQGDGNPANGNEGEEGIASLTVQLYRDVNGDGDYDAGTDTLAGTTTTDANGNYLFTGLLQGNYVVVIPTPPANYTNTGNPVGGAGNPVNQGAATIAGINDAVFTVDFGYQFSGTAANAASIGDLVYADNNNDATEDSGEPGIPGVTVWLYEDTTGNGIQDAGDLLISTTVTFPSVIAGKLDINRDGAITVDDDGLFLGYPIIDGSVDVNSSGTITTADDLANLGGYPVIDGLLDIDRDGTPGEAGDDDLATGSYLFSGLDPNLSFLVIVDTSDTDLTAYFAPNSYTITTAALVAAPASALEPGQAFLTADFGFFGLNPATLGDLVYLDVDRSGTYNAGDIPLAGVTVEIYQDENSDGIAQPGELRATKVTDINGNYLFTGLGPAPYLVKVAATNPNLPTNVFATIAQFSVTLAQGQNFLTADFPYVRFLDKVVDKPVESANGILTYSLSPYVPGNTVLSSVQVTDAVPAGATYNGNDAPAAGSEPLIGATGNLVWNLGSTVAAANGNGTSPGYTPTAIIRSSTAEVDDSYIQQDSGGNWYGNAIALLTQPEATQNKASLIKFTLPAFNGSDVVDRAFIRVMVTGVRSNTTVTMRRLTTAWTEGTGTADGVTWNDPNGTGTAGLWAGGTFSASDYDSTVSYGSYSAPFVFGQTLEFEVTDLVRAWRAGTLANNGVVLVATGTDTGDLMFRSSEGNAAATPGPRLVIAYSQTGSGTFNVRDNFGTVAYNNNDSTSTPAKQWAGGWIEVGDEGDPNTDSIKITGGTLRIRDSVAASIYRSANLSGATAATLTYDLTANSLNAASDVIKLQASITGGASWVDLRTFTLGTTGNGSHNLITALGSVTKDTRIRFVRISSVGGAQSIQVDSVQISYTTPVGGNTSTRLSAGTALLSGTRNVSVSMTVFSDVSGNITPPATLTVTPTGGASATYVSGPTPATGRADSVGGTFTYVYQVNAGAGIGSVRFSGVPAGPAGFTFVAGNSQSVLTTAPLTFQAKVNNPAPSPGPIINTGTITANAGAISYASPPALTATTATIGDFVWADLDGDGVQDVGEPGISGVTVRLYSDNNNDGIINTIGGTDAQVGASAVTDVNGLYRFYAVTPGSNYTVTYDYSTVPTGSVPTSDGDGDAGTTVHDVGTITAALQYATADFGLMPAGTSTIGDTVWRDSNEDGIVDGGETRIANVDVRLYADTNNDGLFDSGDVLVQTVTTNASGNYLFTGVAGTASANRRYFVDVLESDPDFPVGVELVSGGGNLTTGLHTVIVNAAATNYLTADFGYNYGGSIGDTTYYDTNGDGDQDVGETGVDGVVVTLFNDVNNNGEFNPGTDTVVSSIISGGGGLYLFDNRPPGNYIVVAEEQTVVAPPSSANAGLPGYMVDTTGTKHAVTLAANQDYVSADFGFIEGALIEGTTFWDTNHNGVLEGTDTRMPGVTVWLDTDNDGVLDWTDGNANNVWDLGEGEQWTTTDASGDYEFLVSAGSYTVRYLSTDTDWNPVGIRGPSGDQTTVGRYVVNVASGQEIENLNFGRDNSGKIGDRIFADLTNFGVQDITDPGILGVTVLLYNDLGIIGTYEPGIDTFIESQVTDSSGNYLFAGLPDGNYQVKVDTTATSLPESFNPTPSLEQDLSFNSTNAAVVSGGNSLLDRDFGYKLAAATLLNVSGIVWNDQNNNHSQDGAAELVTFPGVTVRAYVDLDGDTVTDYILTTTTSGSGAYTFTGIPNLSTVRIVVDTTTLPSGAYAQTTDPDGNPPTVQDSQHTFTFAGVSLTGKNFGYHCPATWAEWQSSHPLGGENGPTQNPDGDTWSNLEEFAYCFDPSAGVNECALEVVVNGAAMDARVRRMPDLVLPNSGVIYNLEYIADLNNSGPDGAGWTTITTIVPSTVGIPANADGSQVYRYADLESIAALNLGKGFIRSVVTLDSNSNNVINVGEVTVRSPAVGWMDQTVRQACETISLPFEQCPEIAGEVTDNTSSSIDIAAILGTSNLGTLLDDTKCYYVEVVSGTHEGHRFDIVEATSIAGVLMLSGGTETLAANALNGAQIVVRQYKTLGAQFNKNLYTMGTNVSNSDYVLIYQAGVWVTYYLLNVSGTPTWVTAATAPADQGGLCLDPSQGMFVHRRTSSLAQTQLGHVRETKFACPMPVAGRCVLMSNPYPVEASVVDRGLINTTTASAVPFTGSTSASLSDKLYLWRTDRPDSGGATPNAYDVHYYLNYTRVSPPLTLNHYTPAGTSVLTDENTLYLFQPLRSQMLCPVAAHLDYVMPVPWTP